MRKPPPIVNISRKSTEARTKQILAMRESPEPKHIRDRGCVQVRSKTPIVARLRKEGEAPGPTDDLFKRDEYKPDMVLTTIGLVLCSTPPYRRGMDDHAKFSSFGNKT